MKDPVVTLIYALPEWFRPVLPICGGITALLTFGTLYTAGNVTPYMASYLRANVDETINMDVMVWIFTMQMNFPPLFIAVGGWMEHKIGVRLTTLIASLIMSTGILLTYFTIQYSYFTTLLTYGMVFGIGRAIVFGPPISCAMKWLPKNKGLATGLVCLGLGGGGLIFAPIQTKLVNPANYQPNPDGYFSQPDLLDNIPHLFLSLGWIFIVLQVVGSIFLVDPLPESKSGETGEKKPLIEKRTRTITDVYFLPLTKVLKTVSFWWLFLSYFCSSPVINMVSSFYKSFGQTFIQDDIFLATVGSIASVFNALGRIFWGIVADRFSYQVAMATSAVLQAVLMFTFLAAQYGGKAMFMIWVCLLNLGFSANFTLLPLAIAKCFGSQNMAINYGFLTLGLLFSSLIISGLASVLLNSIGYSGIWFISGALALMTFLFTVTIQYTDYGRGLSYRYRTESSEAERVIRKYTISHG